MKKKMELFLAKDKGLKIKLKWAVIIENKIELVLVRYSLMLNYIYQKTVEISREMAR